MKFLLQNVPFKLTIVIAILWASLWMGSAIVMNFSACKISIMTIAVLWPLLNSKPFRPPSKRRLTNMELAEWCAKGRGQWTGGHDHWISYNYDLPDDAPVSEGTKVRKWGDDLWHEPTIDYCGRLRTSRSHHV